MLSSALSRLLRLIPFYTLSSATGHRHLFSSLNHPLIALPQLPFPIDPKRRRFAAGGVSMSLDEPLLGRGKEMVGERVSPVAMRAS